MSAEGIRPSRFAARNARWSHNHRVAWPPESGSPDDVAVPGQGSPVQVPHGNGHANGNGHAHGNGRANGNGHGYGNGPSRMLNVTLSEDERERLKAEVVYWGMQQAQQGRVLTESDLQAEYDRRLSGAQHLLGDLQAAVRARDNCQRPAVLLVRDGCDR